MTGTGGPGRPPAKRDYSYATNYCLCHAEDTAVYLAPAQNHDVYGGVDGHQRLLRPGGTDFGSRTLVIRHNGKDITS